MRGAAGQQTSRSQRRSRYVRGGRVPSAGRNDGLRDPAAADALLLHVLRADHERQRHRARTFGGWQVRVDAHHGARQRLCRPRRGLLLLPGPELEPRHAARRHRLPCVPLHRTRHAGRLLHATLHAAAAGQQHIPRLPRGLHGWAPRPGSAAGRPREARRLLHGVTACLRVRRL